jgi:hypothetical protein
VPTISQLLHELDTVNAVPGEHHSGMLMYGVCIPRRVLNALQIGRKPLSNPMSIYSTSTLSRSWMMSGGRKRDPVS